MKEVAQFGSFAIKFLQLNTVCFQIALSQINVSSNLQCLIKYTQNVYEVQFLKSFLDFVFFENSLSYPKDMM